MIVKKLALVLTAILLCTLYGCDKVVFEKQQRTGFYFDTVVTITAYNAQPSHFEQAFNLCEKYEALFSYTKEGSDIWKINHADGQSVRVSQETINVLKAALEISRLSDGAFDITVASCSTLWDFENGVIPNAKDLAKAVAKTDYQAIEIDNTYVRLKKGMQLDLGGVGKGYIADRLCDFFRNEGVCAIVNLGGDIAVSGENPQGGLWKIGIRDIQDSNALACTLTTSLPTVTSGTYERGFTKDGIRYHHILDPKTGYPAQSGVASVTVVAQTATEADALSTACLVMGIDDGLKLIDNFQGAEAVFITNEGQLLCTKGAEEMLDG